MDNGKTPPKGDHVSPEDLKKINDLRTKAGNYRKDLEDAKEKFELVSDSLNSFVEVLKSRYNLDTDKDKVDWNTGKITKHVEPVKTIRNEVEAEKEAVPAASE